MAVTGYIRVSTAKQTNDHWKLMLTDYAESVGLEAPQWVEDTASGAKPWRERSLGPWLSQASEGDVLIVGEASRIGRDAADALEFVREAKRKGIELHIRPLDPIRPNNGPDSATIILPVLFGMAEYEREQLRYRTKLGLDRAKAQGKRLGGYRRKGMTVEELTDVSEGYRYGGRLVHPNRKAAIKALKRGDSVVTVAEAFNVSRAGLYKWMKEEGIDPRNRRSPLHQA